MKICLKKIIDVAPLARDSVDSFKGERRYVATGSMKDDELFNFEMVSYENRPSRADINVEPGDVIFARMKGTKKVFLVTDSCKDIIISTGFAVFRPSNEIYPRYLFHLINSEQLQHEKDKYCSGATQKAITNDGLENLYIPIPFFHNPKESLKEQERIANILDKADSLRKKRSESITLCDELLKSTFLDMFGDPTTNPKEWPVDELGNFGEIVTGNTPPRIETNNYGDYIEWIKSDNINTPHMFLTKAEEYLSQKGSSIGRIVPRGSILVTCIAGSLSCIGNAAVADREVAFNQQINAIVPNKDYDTYFIYMMIIISKQFIQDSSTNAMKGMISKGSFSKLKFISPPVETQKAFSNIVLKLEDVKQNMLLSLQEMDNQFNGLIQRTFKGDI